MDETPAAVAAPGPPTFATPREVFRPGAGPVPASQVPERQPTD
jgi:hypothetical protein